MEGEEKWNLIFTFHSNIDIVVNGSSHWSYCLRVHSDRGLSMAARLIRVLVVFGVLWSFGAVTLDKTEDLLGVHRAASGSALQSIAEDDREIDNSILAAKKDRKKCKVKRNDNGGFKICPAPRKRDKEAAIQSVMPNQDAEFFCGWGVGCNAVGYSSRGAAYAEWYGIEKSNPRRQVIVARFSSSCSSNRGCVWETWWDPPTNNWTGAAASVYADDYVSFIECFCSNMEHECAIL
jgi:hypothetical protein